MTPPPSRHDLNHLANSLDAKARNLHARLDHLNTVLCQHRADDLTQIAKLIDDAIRLHVAEYHPVLPDDPLLRSTLGLPTKANPNETA